MSRAVQIPQPLLELALLAERDCPTVSSLALRFGLEESQVSQQIEGLRQSNEQILRDHPPAQAGADIRARLAATRLATLTSGKPDARRTRWKGALAVVGAAAAIAVALWFLPAVDPALNATAERPLQRSKGEARLLLFRKTGGTPERLADGSSAQAGDVLQLGYLPAGARHGVLLSIDGAGQVTLHLPSTAAGTSALSERKTMLPFSFRLDHAPGFERFVLITSNEPLRVRELLYRVQSLANASPRAALALPGAVVVDEIVLAKPARKTR